MKNLIIVFTGLLLISCKDKEETVEVPAGFDSKTLVEIMKNPQSISVDEIAKIVGTESGKISIYNEWFSPDVSKRSILYSWPNGEIKTIKTQSGKELKLDAYSSLGIGFIKKTTKQGFRDQFESKGSIQDQINAITNDESMDVDITISEAKNLAENAKLQKFEKLDHIGELAYWEEPVNALHVFVNGIAFTITTNLADESASRKAAIKTLELIMNQ